MSDEKIFVGRKTELEQFKKVLKTPQGKAILVVGNRGMGKTWLINKMAEIALNHPKLKCGCVRYEVTPTDSVDSTMALIMDNAFEAANIEPGAFDKVPQRKKQWMALLKTLVPKGSEIAELIGALRRDPKKNTREQFLERLSLVSKRMQENGRAIFIIDPEKYMQEKSASSWRLVVKELPEKLIFLFAQRTEDELVKSRSFKSLGNVIRIPARRLGVLKESEVEQLVHLRAKSVRKSHRVLCESVAQYKGHPYAIQGALDMIKKTRSIENIPQDPTPDSIAEAQWEEVCDVGDDAIRLFEAYAILEVGVPNEIVQAVSGLETTSRKRLQKRSFIKGLLREEGYGKRIYHTILADYILGQINEAEKKEYHSRAVQVYREKLKEATKKQIVPDALAATRLPEHVLIADGIKAFVDAFVKECFEALFNLGMLDNAITLSERSLAIVNKGSRDEGAVLGNLGLIYKTKGDFDEAQRMFRESMDIHKKLGGLKDMANDYANLGIIYAAKGDLKKAEIMHQRALDIDERVGNLQGMANQYNNLGAVYRKRGDFDKAENMYRKALQVNETLNIAKGKALQYGNLGQIYRMKADLDKAEEMHRRSLEIAEKLGLQELIARNYTDLGLVYARRGHLGKAESMLRKALQIDKALGRVEGIVFEYGNLGSIYYTKGESEKAEQMFKKSLEISERLGLQDATANQYSNLGAVYKQLGDTKRAREYWAKALDLYKRIGMTQTSEKVQGLIEGLGKD